MSTQPRLISGAQQTVFFNIFVARRTAHDPENNKHQCTERGYLQLIVQDHQLPAIQQQQRAHLARMGDPTTVRLS